MFWLLLVAVCPLLTKGFAVKQADCLEISTSLCEKMSVHLLEALNQYKNCMEHRELRFSSFNDGDCPPPCMVKYFSMKCVVRVTSTKTDPIALLTWPTFEDVINTTVGNGGNCPMPFVLNKIDDSIGEMKNWLQIFCTCIDCKLRKLFEEGGCLNVDKMRKIIEECFDETQNICPQTVIIQRLFVEAYLRFLTSHVNFDCCFDKPCSDTAVAPTTTPVPTMAPTTTPVITVAPTTTQATTVAPTTTPATTVVTTVITTPETCNNKHDDLCYALRAGTAKFLTDYSACISTEDGDYMNANNVSCSGNNAASTFSSECFAIGNNFFSLTNYAKGEQLFFKRMNATIDASNCPDNPPADALIEKATTYKTALSRWFGHFCECMHDNVTVYYQANGNCNSSEFNQYSRDCYDVATAANGGNAFLPGQGGFSNLYDDYLLDNDFP